MKIRKDIKAVNIIAFAILLILTLIRLIIGLRIPLFLQGEAKYDDYMMVEYARDIMQGSWLGAYGYKSLIKTASFSLLLDLGYRLHISYAGLMTILFIAAVIILALVINKLTGSKLFAALFYLFMIFSPVMLYEENVQKVYRGGYIIVFAIFIIAGVLGIFAYFRDSNFKLAGFVVLLSLALPVFWYLKEDSIWIIPFVVGGLVATAIRSLMEKKDKSFLVSRLVLCIIPLLILVLSISAYRGINKKIYGVYADNDRSGTYFKEVISDLLHIEGAASGETWLTQEKLHEACLVSDTLRKMAYEMDMISANRFEEDGEVHGDYIIWMLREAGDAHGIYTSAIDAEAYWKQVHEELTEAYEDGRLKRDKSSIYISSIARGFSLTELKEYYGERLGQAIKIIIGYDINRLSLKEANGSQDRIDLMHELAGGSYIGSDTSDSELKKYERTVNLANHINSLYGRSGRPVFLASALGILLLLIRFVAALVKKEECDYAWNLLIILGMGLTAMLLIFAVMWFCNFLTVWKIYDYSGGAVILIEIIEALGIYYLIDSVRTLIKKRRG